MTKTPSTQQLIDQIVAQYVAQHVAAKRERCANIAVAIDSKRGNEK